ncbi:hypothetical protein [Deinococcus multiflagellatus]|uniref:Uncharacterized protein n=1 Tax=Deinococcus multiflagellatus TaxID=1656887 RepID=A0ABW1ZJF7_9DEIO
MVAYLNLDNLQNHAAFSARSADIAEAFATQIAALLAAQRRQAQEAARRRELEGLLSVTAALREVAHSAQAQGCWRSRRRRCWAPPRPRCGARPRISPRCPGPRTKPWPGRPWPPAP